MTGTTEPRTRSAADVADHASLLLDEVQSSGTSCPTCGHPRTGKHPDGPYGRCDDCEPEVNLPWALGVIERLAAQVEDLAAVVAELQGEGDQ